MMKGKHEYTTEEKAQFALDDLCDRLFNADWWAEFHKELDHWNRTCGRWGAGTARRAKKMGIYSPEDPRFLAAIEKGLL